MYVTKQMATFFTVPVEYMDDFPTKNMPVKLIFKDKPYDVKFYNHDTHHGFSCLKQIWKENSLDKEGKVSIFVLEKGKKYRLEIVK